MTLLSGAAHTQRLDTTNITPEQFLVPSDHAQRLAIVHIRRHFSHKKSLRYKIPQRVHATETHIRWPSCAAGPGQTHTAKADKAAKAVLALATPKAHMIAGGSPSRERCRYTRARRATGQTHRWVSLVVALVALHRLVVVIAAVAAVVHEALHLFEAR